VRETAAQALATLLPFMSTRSIISVHRILIGMIQQEGAPPSRGLDQPSITSESKSASKSTSRNKSIVATTSTIKYFWQVRHSGLLGLKYLVAVKGDLIKASNETVDLNGDAMMTVTDTSNLLKGVVDAALLGLVSSFHPSSSSLIVKFSSLRDRDDDVRSAAAATIAPVIDSIVTQLPSELHSLIDILWNCLGDSKDDLSSSVGGVMDLLGASGVSQLLTQN
jgi:TATA-binding protein-associated factor